MGENRQTNKLQKNKIFYLQYLIIWVNKSISFPKITFYKSYFFFILNCSFTYIKLSLSPVYMIQVLHPSLHSRKLGSRNLNSSLCIHDARNFDEYTQVLAGDATNKMAFLGGKEGAALCIALLCTIVVRRRLSSNKRSTMGCISMKSISSSIISLVHVTLFPAFWSFLFSRHLCTS